MPTQLYTIYDNIKSFQTYRFQLGLFIITSKVFSILKINPYYHKFLYVFTIHNIQFTICNHNLPFKIYHFTVYNLKFYHFQRLDSKISKFTFHYLEISKLTLVKCRMSIVYITFIYIYLMYIPFPPTNLKISFCNFEIIDLHVPTYHEYDTSVYR